MYFAVCTIQGSAATVNLAGKNVFHDGSLFAKLKVLNGETCVVITDYEDAQLGISRCVSLATTISTHAMSLGRENYIQQP